MDINALKEKLLTLDQVKEQLAVYENLERHPFHTDGGNQVQFHLPVEWDEPLADQPGLAIQPATVDIDGSEYPLTKDALLEATSLIGISKDFAAKTPAPLIEGLLNHWMANGTKYLQLVHNGTFGMAFTRASVNVTSPLMLLESVLDATKSTLGSEPLADYKFQNDLHRTGIRLIAPEHTVNVPSQRFDDEGLDPWSMGVAVEHSILGETALSVHGYLFAWWCTNGAITMEHSISKHRKAVNETDEDTQAWIADAAEFCLEELPHEMAAVTQLPKQDLDGDLSATAQQLFDRFKVPVAARTAVLDNLADSDDFTAYGVMNAVTQVANKPELSDAQAGELMRIGGAMPHVLAGMCQQCHRM